MNERNIPQDNYNDIDYYEDFPHQKPREREEGESIGIIKEMSARKVLEQLRMNLKGYFWDFDLKKFVQLEGIEPLMNDKGISKYLSIVSAPVSDIITFSSFKDTEVAPLTEYLCEKAIPVVHINYKEYGVKEKSDLEILDIQLLYYTLGALKKAVGGGDRGVIGRTISENIMQRSGGQQNPFREEKKGFFSRLNPFSRS